MRHDNERPRLYVTTEVASEVGATVYAEICITRLATRQWFTALGYRTIATVVSAHRVM